MAEFWDIIEGARGSDGGSADAERVQATLTGLTTEEIVAFDAEYVRRMVELQRWDLWGAGYVIGGGMSDDGFHYFKAWIIGLGREAYELALRDPDALGSYADDPEQIENEELNYAAATVLESRGEDTGGLAADPEGDPVGEAFDEETVGEAYPRLTGKFG